MFPKEKRIFAAESLSWLNNEYDFLKNAYAIIQICTDATDWNWDKIKQTKL